MAETAVTASSHPQSPTSDSGYTSLRPLSNFIKAFLYLSLLFGLFVTGHGIVEQGTEPIPDSNKHAACSACTEIVKIIAFALESPSPELLHQGQIQEYITGKRVHVPYVKSQQYAEDILGAVCNSSLLARLVRTEDWLGLPYYAPDDVPVFLPPAARIDQELFSACKALTRRLLQPPRGTPRLTDIVRTHRAWGAPAFICTNVVPDCRWKGSWSGRLSAGVDQAIWYDPSVLLRLAPLAVILVTVPVLVGIPFLRGGSSRSDDIKVNGSNPMRKGKSRTKRKQT